MNRYPLPLAVLFLSVLLVLPAAVSAEEDSYEKDAIYAEGNPPVVPHLMEPDTTGAACLVCHLEGKSGAPISPHAVRIDCVQCHVQGEIKVNKKAASKMKKKHKEAE